MELPDYQQYLRIGEQRLALEDPLQGVVDEFLELHQHGADSAAELLLAAHRNLLQLGRH